jgi:hypothetical protein
MIKLLGTMTALIKSCISSLKSRSVITSYKAEEPMIKLEPLPTAKSAALLGPPCGSSAVTCVDVPHFMQENLLSWCYAACAEMVLSAYFILVTQCRIVTFVKSFNCCDNPNDHVCVGSGASHADIADIYTNFGGVAFNQVQPIGGVLSLSDVQAELSANKPIEVTVEWLVSPGSFHAVIIRGFLDNWIYINDPLSNEDFIVVTYDELLSDGSYVWDETWIGFPPV